MLDAGAFILGSGADLLGIGGDFREKQFHVNSAARRPERVERDHRLREQVDRGLAAAAFEAQMERRGDSIERRREFLEFVLDLSRRDFEALGGGEILAAIERFDRAVELLVVALAAQSCSFSSTARNSSSLSARALRVPYFS